MEIYARYFDIKILMEAYFNEEREPGDRNIVKFKDINLVPSYNECFTVNEMKCAITG